MAKDFIAIDPKKKVKEFSEKGIESLKELHRIQRKQGWQYGHKSQLKELLGKIITPQDAQNAIKENEILKQELEALKAAAAVNVEPAKRGRKPSDESEK
ncbi:MAG TPA: hypothetical protein PLR63_05410 [Paludibacteraceae bacterium]|nr:hypothetical protein [Paludibacteraceae bacterium]